MMVTKYRNSYKAVVLHQNKTQIKEIQTELLGFSKGNAA